MFYWCNFKVNNIQYLKEDLTQADWMKLLSKTYKAHRAMSREPLLAVCFRLFSYCTVGTTVVLVSLLWIRQTTCYTNVIKSPLSAFPLPTAILSQKPLNLHLLQLLASYNSTFLWVKFNLRSSVKKHKFVLKKGELGNCHHHHVPFWVILLLAPSHEEM